MKCFMCNNDFEPKKNWGGQNRKMCYNCIPADLSQKDREKLLYNFFKSKIDDDKLSKGCDRCGYNKCAVALEWHHPNKDKEVNPADLLTNRTIKSYERYLDEISKCELLCANCHREEHFGGMV